MTLSNVLLALALAAPGRLASPRPVLQRWDVATVTLPRLPAGWGWQLDTPLDARLMQLGPATTDERGKPVWRFRALAVRPGPARVRLRWLQCRPGCVLPREDARTIEVEVGIGREDTP